MTETRRTALITGATKGIGWGIAQRFAEGQIDLLLTSRNRSELECCRQDLEKRFPRLKVKLFVADLSEKTQVMDLVTFVRDSGGLDILVNNAGVFLPGEILQESEGVLEKTMSINLYSAYHLTRGVIDLVKRSERGYIINMCSIASLAAYPNGGSYTISKFAMLGMTKVLREELKSSGVAVSAVMPGATWSASWDGAPFPRERLMEVHDIAETCWQIVNMAPNAVIEEVIIRPQLGDL